MTNNVPTIHETGDLQLYQTEDNVARISEREMTECEEVRLEDIATDVSYGYTASADDALVGPKFLRITDIQGGTVDWSKVPYCEIEESLISKYLLEEGDIVIARTGNSTGENYLYTGNERAVFASYLIRFRINSKQADAHFVWYNLRSNRWKDFVAGAKTGSAQAGANAKILGSFKFGLPPLSKQKAIADVLSAFDNKIELSQRMNDTLEGVAQALFKSWFVDFDPVKAKAEGRKPEGMNEVSATLFPENFVDLSSSYLPEGWKITTLSKCTDLQNGYAFKSGDWTEFGVPVVKIGSVKPMIVEVNNATFVSEKIALERSNFRLEAGDILIGLTGYVGEVGRVPRLQVLPILNQRVGRFVPKPNYYAWVYALTRSMVFKAFVETKSHGSAQANVSTHDILTYPVILPTPEVLEAFERLCKPLLDKILDNSEQSHILISIRDILLPRLISGKLRVNEISKTMEALVS